MGIQETITLTRDEAEKKCADKLLEEKYYRIARSEAVLMDDKELEDYLDEHFYNYSIEY